MIVAEFNAERKADHPLVEWASEESIRIAAELLDRMPPAVRQAMQSLEDIESGVRSMVQQVGQHLTEGFVGASVPPRLGVCGVCSQPLQLVDAHRPLTMTGIFGDYRWARPYGTCPQGHGSAAPQDQVLPLGPGHASPLLAKLLTRLAVEVPFDQVPELVLATLNLPVDGEMVRRVTENVGTWAEDQEQLAVPSILSDTPPPVPSAPGPSTLLLSLDGAMVHTQRVQDGDQGWHEAKVGVCSRFEPMVPTAEDDPVHPDPQRSTYCIGFEPRTQFWPRLYWHALQAGLEDPTCHQIVLIGDGAHWIWEDGAAHLRPVGKTWYEI